MSAPTKHPAPGHDAELPDATVRRESRGGGGRRTLQVLGEGFHSSYPLAASGKVTIGRSNENLIAIDDPELSRNHLVLHLGETISLEDLGSSNGTHIGERQLSPREVVTLAPGEPVRVGSTTLLVLERAVETASRRLWSYDYFEARIDEECRRAIRTATSFALLHVRCDPPTAGAVVERRLVALLPDLDVVARYVPGEWQVLLVGADEAQASAVASRLTLGLADDRVRVRVGAAAYPIDGSTADELVTAVAARVDGADEESTAESERGPVVEDPSMRELFRLAERIAPSRIHVLVVGETGTGKEVLAEEIHRRSGRGDAPLRRIDCAALPAERADAVLFGADDVPGALAAAEGGTVLLDEVCLLSLATQARLLALLDGAGGTLDVRVVATSCRDLEAEVAAGRLREELYFRLDGITLAVPPLRRRPREISALAERFVQEAAQAAGRAEAPMLSDAALALLSSYPWPGNVRELRNVMRRALLLCDGDEIEPAHLPVEKLSASFAQPSREGSLPPAAAVPPLREVKEQYVAAERQRIIDALERCHGNQTEAAKLLGIARRTLIKRLDAYGLPRPRKK
ncbi:MAG: sigma 54-interacting transcriptional regulator [Deltaproteobacteria bacterium]|nr:sigma 54-interacting transcriptional regulator [Deltaproteobacteria bacterium]MBK8240482.1 sigma 54-interacting transcriptional regulator [Deltaproteobacteria bacterium]MBK8718239.1 sigma 54-interacting transcriptional regulator [Deltaproteobacteria bacterium]MBP7289025.1 sigma 54-interacting transcriptional regulator [Nannocystaceae bacterium]